MEPEPQYYEIDEADIDTQPNSADVRELTGFRYFGTGSLVEVMGFIPDETTILARQQQLLDEVSLAIQESCPIAKMTTRCALYMNALKVFECA